MPLPAIAAAVGPMLARIGGMTAMRGAAGGAAGGATAAGATSSGGSMIGNVATQVGISKLAGGGGGQQQAPAPQSRQMAFGEGYANAEPPAY